MDPITDMFNIIKNNDKPEEWNLWWHSHPDFGTFFSVTDNKTIRELSEATTLYAICFNKNGDMEAEVSRNTITETLKARVVIIENTTTYKECEKEVKELVSKHKYQYRTPYKLDKGGRRGYSKESFKYSYAKSKGVGHYVWDRKLQEFIRFDNSEDARKYEEGTGDSKKTGLHASVGNSRSLTVCEQKNNNNRSWFARKRSNLMFDKNGVYIGRGL